MGCCELGSYACLPESQPPTLAAARSQLQKQLSLTFSTASHSQRGLLISAMLSDSFRIFFFVAYTFVRISKSPMIRQCFDHNECSTTPSPNAVLQSPLKGWYLPSARLQPLKLGQFGIAVSYTHL